MLANLAISRKLGLLVVLGLLVAAACAVSGTTRSARGLADLAGQLGALVSRFSVIENSTVNPEP